MIETFCTVMAAMVKCAPSSFNDESALPWMFHDKENEGRRRRKQKSEQREGTALDYRDRENWRK